MLLRGRHLPVQRRLGMALTANDVLVELQADSLLAELADGVPDAVLVVDEAGLLVLVNHQTEVLFGYARGQLLGQPVELLVPQRLRDQHRLDRRQYAQAPTGRPMGASRILRGRRSDCTEFPVEITLAPLTLAHGSAVAAIVRDVSSQAEVEAELVHRSLHDPLTGLPNRTLLMDRLRTTLARRPRPGTTTAVLFVDVDHLKRANDSLGHDAGDALLRAIASRMVGALRPSDAVGRVSGDEFIAVIEQVHGAIEALALANRVMFAVRAAVTVSGHELQPTVSIGLAVATPASDGEQLVRESDWAMYRAKRNGRDRIEVFREQWRADGQRAHDLSRALSDDIEQATLDVHFQPVIELASDRTWGVETLLRWRSPHGELLAARDVLALAEQSQLLPALDRAVLGITCRNLGDLAISRGLRIGVNASGRYLSTTGLPQGIAHFLHEFGLPATSLWLDLADGQHLDPDNAKKILPPLQALGITVAIDDFGAGLSSLARLRELPADVLKIDPSFTRDIDTDHSSQTVVGAIIALAHSLGLIVLAGDVERDAQLATLQSLGCDLARGYFWTPALPEPALRTWLDGRPD
jgi:diguanylate cyclase (GGDEF)-like protein/PAS domain S-box-containing protein